jgi:hypothetical protein
MQSFLLQLFLFLHVMGAIVAFGPTFVFPFIASQVQKDPRHGHFAAVLGEVIEKRLVLPGAIIQGITGLALILIIGVDLTSRQWHWLGVAIILYLIAIAISILYQARAAARMVELTAAAGPAAAGPPAGGPPAGGPPPQIIATGQQLQRGGQVLGLLLIAIVILMVIKPTF